MGSWKGHEAWMARADTASRNRLLGPLNPRSQGSWDRATYKSTSTLRAQPKLSLNLPFIEFFLFFFMACNLPWRATTGKVNMLIFHTAFLVNIYLHHAILSSWNTIPTFQTNELNYDRSSRCVSILLLGWRVPPQCPQAPSSQFHKASPGGDHTARPLMSITSHSQRNPVTALSGRVLWWLRKLSHRDREHLPRSPGTAGRRTWVETLKVWSSGFHNSPPRLPLSSAPNQHPATNWCDLRTQPFLE